jgi:hypothetical protein
MTIGPAFQYAFTPFKHPGPSIFNLYHLNLYTMPAYLACVINLLGIVALYTLFVEKYDGIIDEVRNFEVFGGKIWKIRRFLCAFDFVQIRHCQVS